MPEQNSIRVVSVNISEHKGTIKEPVPEIKLTSKGITGDAHAGEWHRQVSLLGTESIRKMEPAVGRNLKYGEFAENITTEGFELFSMQPLDLLECGSVILQVTQIGKKCHGKKCEIFRQTGDCVMPSEGVFCRVISGGSLKAGDILTYTPKTIRLKIITLSDRASRGEYRDLSGPLIHKTAGDYLKSKGRTVCSDLVIIPDDAEKLGHLITQSVKEEYDLIFTTGGTGIGPRDISPDVIKPLLEKEIPGIMELVRIKYGMQFPNALLSRSVAGVIKKTVVYVLPGSPGAVQEYLAEILPTIEHTIYMLHAIDKHG